MRYLPLLISLLSNLPPIPLELQFFFTTAELPFRPSNLPISKNEWHLSTLLLANPFKQERAALDAKVREACVTMVKMGRSMFLNWTCRPSNSAMTGARFLPTPVLFPSDCYPGRLVVTRSFATLQASGGYEFNALVSPATDRMIGCSTVECTRRETGNSKAGTANHLSPEPTFRSERPSVRYRAGHEVRLVTPVSGAKMVLCQRVH